MSSIGEGMITNTMMTPNKVKNTPKVNEKNNPRAGSLSNMKAPSKVQTPSRMFPVSNDLNTTTTDSPNKSLDGNGILSFISQEQSNNAPNDLDIFQHLQTATSQQILQSKSYNIDIGIDIDIAKANSRSYSQQMNRRTSVTNTPRITNAANTGYNTNLHTTLTPTQSFGNSQSSFPGNTQQGEIEGGDEDEFYREGNHDHLNSQTINNRISRQNSSITSNGSYNKMASTSLSSKISQHDTIFDAFTHTNADNSNNNDANSHTVDTDDEDVNLTQCNSIFAQHLANQSNDIQQLLQRGKYNQNTQPSASHPIFDDIERIATKTSQTNFDKEKLINNNIHDQNLDILDFLANITSSAETNSQANHVTNNNLQYDDLVPMATSSFGDTDLNPHEKLSKDQIKKLFYTGQLIPHSTSTHSRSSDTVTNNPPTELIVRTSSKDSTDETQAIHSQSIHSVQSNIKNQSLDLGMNNPNSPRINNDNKKSTTTHYLTTDSLSPTSASLQSTPPTSPTSSASLLAANSHNQTHPSFSVPRYRRENEQAIASKILSYTSLSKVSTTASSSVSDASASNDGYINIDLLFSPSQSTSDSTNLGHYVSTHDTNTNINNKKHQSVTGILEEDGDKISQLYSQHFSTPRQVTGDISLNNFHIPNEPLFSTPNQSQLHRDTHTHIHTTIPSMINNKTKNSTSVNTSTMNTPIPFQSPSSTNLTSIPKTQRYNRSNIDYNTLLNSPGFVSPKPSNFPAELLSMSSKRVVTQLRSLAISLWSTPSGLQPGSSSIRTLLQRELILDRTISQAPILFSKIHSVYELSTKIKDTFEKSVLGSLGAQKRLQDDGVVIRFENTLKLFEGAQKEQARRRQEFEDHQKQKKKRAIERKKRDMVTRLQLEKQQQGLLKEETSSNNTNQTVLLNDLSFLEAYHTNTSHKTDADADIDIDINDTNTKNITKTNTHVGSRNIQQQKSSITTDIVVHKNYIKDTDADIDIDNTDTDTDFSVSLSDLSNYYSDTSSENSFNLSFSAGITDVNGSEGRTTDNNTNFPDSDISNNSQI